MAFPPRRSNSSDRNDGRGPSRSSFNRERGTNSFGNHRQSSGAPVSLSSRFSSIASERISKPYRSNNSYSPRGSISKPRNQPRTRKNNDRGMEIDQVGGESSSNERRGRNKGNRPPQPRNGSSKTKVLKKSQLSSTDLDKELESYMMKNESTARNTLDMELDSYMSTAPSKQN
ncbi:hypothetical protein C9890_0621 [Perkinsus sp. BL_2016]|nr:hypothetical protein C9890_0621 [Perkinsus sp. BL_2016]